MNRRKLKNPSLLQTTFGVWATLMKVTEWLVAIQLIAEHVSGQKITFPLLNIYQCHPAVAKLTTESFFWFWSKFVRNKFKRISSVHP
jgi:hypothetical protein